MEYKFKAEITHDLPTHKEFQKTYNRCTLLLPLLCLFYSGYLIWNMTLFTEPVDVYRFLFIALVIGLMYILTHPRKGDIQYKRMLQNNDGQPIHILYEFGEDGIYCTEPESGNKHTYHYDSFQRVIESPVLILLVMKHRSCILMSKNSIEGGTAEEFLTWFLEKCPNVKRKKSRKTGFGKWCYRILTVTVIIGTVFALLNLPGIALFSRLSGQLQNDMSYQEMADALAPLDIRITRQSIDELEAYDADHFETYGEDFYKGSTSNQKVWDLLYWEGTGVYDDDTWEWTPSASGIYWVELEAYNADSIYTDFLTGLSAMHEDLSFENVREDFSDVNPEEGTGTVTLSFDLDGQHYEFDAQYNADWFDTDMMYHVGRILAADDNPRDLYFCSDDYSGLMLYYGDANQVRQLEKLTGVDFHDTVNMLMGH